MAAILDLLEVRIADLTPARAVLSVRLPGAKPHWSLTGFVRGPRCSRGSTLPAKFRLQSRLPASGRGAMSEDAAAGALITEPVYWSPDWPALYDLAVELQDGSQTLEQATRSIGIRALKVVNRRFDFGGKHWVLRGVRRDCPEPTDLGTFREHGAALLAPAAHLTEQILAEASESGVMLIAELSSQDDHQHAVSQLSRHAAVAIVVLPADVPIPPASGNMLPVRRLVQGEPEPPADEAKAAMAQVRDAAKFADWASRLSRAVIAYRPLAEAADPATARAACDRLQRDLAPYGQFAGYIV